MVCQLTFIFKPVKTWREGFWSIEVEVSRGLMVTTFLPKVIFNPEPVGTFSDYGHEDWLKYGQILILLARTPGWLLASLGPAGLESEPCDDSDICSKNSTKDMWTSETVLKPPRTHSSTAMHLQRVAKKKHMNPRHRNRNTRVLQQRHLKKKVPRHRRGLHNSCFFQNRPQAWTVIVSVASKKIYPLCSECHLADISKVGTSFVEIVWRMQLNN